MKKSLLALVISTIFSLTCVYGQHLLYLKSGDNLKGELIGGKKDTVYFKFMSNRLALPISQMNAIYFDESTAPKALADPYADMDAKLIGYVTDVHVLSEVEMPDAGTSVYIVKEADVKGFDYKLVADTFQVVNMYRDMYNLYVNGGMQVPDELKVMMKVYNVDTDAKFESVCRRTNKNISLLKNNKKAIKAVCDNDGKFSMPVASGTYYILIVSKNTTSATSVEAGGRVYCVKASVQQNEEYVIPPVKFEVQD